RYGAMLEEVVWADDPVPFAPQGAAEATRLLRPITRLAPRLPRTMRRVEFVNGEIVEAVQALSKTSPIPGGREARKLCYYVLDERPGRWDGTSLLRAAWGPWKL